MEAKAAVGPNLGLPFTENVAGEEVTVTLLHQANQGVLEDKLISARRSLLQKEKAFMSDGEYGAVYNDFHDRIVAGHYSFGAELMEAWLKTFPGMAVLLEVCTGKPKEFWKPLLQGKAQEECARIIARVWADSFPN